jgi:hypothetical protein
MLPLDEKNGALAAAQAAAAPLPRLRSNNSIAIPAEDGPNAPRKEPAIPVSKSAYKTEHCIKENIRIAAETYGLETLAFFTLTFAKPTFSAKCAQQRMNSLLTNIVRKRYGTRYLGVLERHETGAIHFHFVIHVGEDIRTGFDWNLAGAAYAAAREKNFNKARQLWGAAAASAKNGNFLRGEWAFWRGTRERYRWLGRCELVPIRSTSEAIARYTGGYIAKHMQHRRKEDKGVRLVRTGKGMRFVNSHIAFVSPKARLFRRKLAAFVAQPHIQAAGVREYADMKRVFGKKWGYHLLIPILSMPLYDYPSGIDAQADGVNVPRDSVDIRIERRYSDAETERRFMVERRMKVARDLFCPPKQEEPDIRTGAWYVEDSGSEGGSLTLSSPRGDERIENAP